MGFHLAVAGMTLGLAALAWVEASTQQQGSPAGPRCFNFQDATDYKITGPSQIRVKTRAAGEFDVALLGAACLSGKSTLAIDRAPVADICLGRQGNPRHITFKREKQDPVICKIDLVSRPAPEAKDASAGKKPTRRPKGS